MTTPETIEVDVEALVERLNARAWGADTAPEYPDARRRHRQEADDLEAAVAALQASEAARLKAEEERDELQRTFDTRWEADQRAIKRWQAEKPGRDLTWPDHVDLVIWLAARLDEQVCCPKATERLADHWLCRMICDHDAKTDVAVCSCGLWSSEPLPSIGDAAKAWAAHALDAVKGAI